MTDSTLATPAAPADAVSVTDWDGDIRGFLSTLWTASTGATACIAGTQRTDGQVERHVVIEGVERATGGAMTADEAIEYGRFLINLGHQLRTTG